MSKVLLWLDIIVCCGKVIFLCFWCGCVLKRLQFTSEVKQSSGWKITNYPNKPANLPRCCLPCICVLFYLSAPRQLYCFSRCFDSSVSETPPPGYGPSHSLVLPGLIVPLCIYLVLSPPSFPPLFFILHAASCSHFILTPPSPPPGSFSSLLAHTHPHKCDVANTIPHISNEYFVIILSPLQLSVWLRLSSDSVTNGTTSFLTAAIPQYRQRCSAALQMQLRAIVDQRLWLISTFAKTFFFCFTSLLFDAWAGVVQQRGL